MIDLRLSQVPDKVLRRPIRKKSSFQENNIFVDQNLCEVERIQKPHTYNSI
jgi:hypothetical protein